MEHYYRACFYHEDHEKNWNFYIRSNSEMTDKEVQAELHEFLGVDGLEQHHLDNLNFIEKVSAEDFEASTGMEV